ncbi:MAG: hypothetical protein JSS12_02590, partial [Verrucomicrobia bacterium]|nr:hypothetical protein [Verrucomicrobiota bacterium]
MRIALLLFTFFCLSLFADDEFVQQDVEIHPDALPSLINLTSLPSAIVNGCVNVISGDLYEYEQDDTVSGGNSPYMLGHSYASSSLEEGNLGAGWNFLHYHLLEVFQPDRIQYVKKGGKSMPYLCPFELTEIYKECIGKRTLFPEAIEALSPPKANPSLFAHPLEFLSSSLIEKGTNRLEREGEPAFLSLYEPSGGRFVFKGRYNSERKKGMRRFKLLTKHSGITNVTHGVISGQTNIKNINLKWDKDKDRFYVKLGDGTTRTYIRQWKYKEMVRKRPHHATYYRDYHLESEVLPNGNKRFYHYNDAYEVTSIATYNKNLSQKLSEVIFEHKTPKDFSKAPSLNVKTSDNHTHTYYFERLDGKKLKGLYAVSSLDRFTKPKTYFKYSEKDHTGKRRLIEKRSEDGFYIKTEYYKSGRVKCQRSPMGTDGQEIVTHQFFYKDWEDGSGRCSVRDAHNRLTRYYWNKDKRLKAITRLDEDKNMLMHEEFHWSDN